MYRVRRPEEARRGGEKPQLDGKKEATTVIVTWGRRGRRGVSRGE